MSGHSSATRRETVQVGVASFFVAAFVSWLNADNDLQGTVYRHDYLGLARFLRGEGDVEVFTYPVWGFPAVLAATHYSAFWTVALQCLVASVALAALYGSAARCVRSRPLLAFLCIVALPWFALASAKSADIWSAGLGVFAVVCLARMFEERSSGYAILAALLLGLSLHFRSDYLAFVVALPLGVLVLAPRYLRPHAMHFACIAVVALLTVVPWGFFRVAHGAPFGITSTNAGMAMVNSLGFQGNRWGIVSNDRVRRAEILEALGPEVPAHSVEGNAFFQARWRQAVAENPGEFARKVGKNWVTTVMYGFYGIETEPYLEGQDVVAYDVLKEQLKSMAGARANPVDIEAFREQGLWDEDFSLSDVPARLWMIASLRLVTVALSSFYLLVLLVALGRLVFFDRPRLAEPMLLSCAIAVLYTFALLGLLQNEPRQANVLYVLGIPLVVDLVDRLRFGAPAPSGSSGGGSPPSRRSPAGNPGA